MGNQPTKSQKADYADREHNLYGVFKTGVRPAQKLLDDIQKLAEGMTPVWEKPSSGLERFSSLLLSPAAWLAKLREYNAKYWDNRLSDEDFAKAETRLALVPEDYRVQSVDDLIGFHVQFDSTEETFKMWYKVYQGELPGAWQWEELKFDAEHFRLHPMARRYEPGIHLVHTNLLAHWEPENGRTLIEVREQAVSRRDTSQREILAQLEVISIYGALPKLFMEQDGENLPYSDMPGTEFRLNVPKKESDEEKAKFWPHALCLRWSRDDRRARFLASDVVNRTREWSAPVLWES